MRRYIKSCIAGVGYGMFPVLLSLLLLYNLDALAISVGRLAGLEQGLVLQISQALQQLQEGEVVVPWLFGVVLALLSVGGLLLTREHRKLRVAFIVVGAVLLLPLTLGAFGLMQVNDVQVWRAIAAIAPLLKAL